MGTPKRWTILLLIGLGIYILGGAAGFFLDEVDSDVLIAIFLFGTVTGGISSLVAMVFLGVSAEPGSATAGGLISLFLAFFVPFAYEHFGGPLNVHGSAGITVMSFGVLAGLGGLILTVIGFVRVASARE